MTAWTNSAARRTPAILVGGLVALAAGCSEENKESKPAQRPQRGTGGTGGISGQQGMGGMQGTPPRQ